MSERLTLAAQDPWADQFVRLGELVMSSERDGDMHAISLNGEMDVANAGDVELELAWVEAGDARVILMDLSGLTFMDCTAMRLLSSAGERARARGEHGRLLVLRPPQHVYRALRTAGVDKLLSFAD